MSDELWFVIHAGNQEGPYTKEGLKKLPWISFETLVWREGLLAWTPIQDLEELRDLFEEPAAPPDENLDAVYEEGAGAEDLALSLQNAAPPVWFWILCLIMILVYAILQSP